MADHEELVAEMLALEQMGTQERQKLAKKRRMQQLKKWGQREKEWLAKEKQLNRRLANRLNEENNGLNLKQYTTYNSNQRTKKRTPPVDSISSNNNSNSNGNNNNNNNNGDNGTSGASVMAAPKATPNGHTNGNRYNNSGANGVKRATVANGNTKRDDNQSPSNTINNNNLTSIDGPYVDKLTPHGRVYFEVGVMLLEAAARNDYDEVKRLLTLGVSPDSVNHDGLTALHQCCIDASESIMNLLLEFGANVDARDTERWTPLHAACTCGHLNLVKILVSHGADLLAVNGDNNMPFDICEDEATLDYIESQMIKRGITQEMIDTMRASSEIQMHAELERLIGSGEQVDLNRADPKDGVTQLHVAAANNYLSVARMLLEHGANVNVCDNDLWRPLHGVGCWGNEQHIKMAELLVEAGADLDSKTNSDETVFDLCDNAVLLERLNQLKDELESKRGSGTDRLRRTQSRTNSRVHSVRRTRVQDKNQISRREAREEAMLRVESCENINGGAEQQQQQSQAQTHSLLPAPSEPSGTTQPDSNGHSETQADRCLSSKDAAAPKMESQVVSETNLDLISTLPIDSKTASSEAECEKAPKPRGVDQVDSAPGKSTQTARSQQERRDSDQLRDQTALSSCDRQVSQKPLSSSNITTMKVSAPITPRKVNSEIISSQSEASSRTTLNSSDRTSGPQATSRVQVHFTPMNYTLANLKKHRSEVRMRTAVIGGGGGCDGGGSNPTAQLDPEPSLSLRDASGSAVDMVHANGWTPGSSDGSSFNKFHGEPSETIEYRQFRYKCCTIM